MPMRLDTGQPDFDDAFSALMGLKRETTPEVADAVRGIIDDVRTNGDEALCRLTTKFDRLDLTPDTLRVGAEAIEAAVAATPMAVRDALAFARDRIAAFHERHLPAGLDYVDEVGVRLGARWSAVESAGLYVPGGLASYPSSVLMNAVPARVAGVKRLAMCVPCPGGEISPAVLAAAELAGVDEIYRIGGAQAVAALAYGTATVAPVAKIVGPGNAYVAEAKRQVFGTVGIDMIAGPSEVVVIADGSANPAWIAADLLAQAEHGAGAQSILLTTEERIADEVAAEVERQLATLPRGEIAREGWEAYGAIIVTKSLTEAIGLSNRLAPEHLELALDDPDAAFAEVTEAGAVFLGHHTPEAVGDYVAGTNHVLPTARSAHFASGLGILDFMKRTSFVGCSPEGLDALAEATVTLAAAEGLDAHGRSVSIRRNR